MTPERNSTPTLSAEPTFPSGAWRGYYLHRTSHDRHAMFLTLSFANGVVDGAGTDDLGLFIIEGSYDAQNLELNWKKSYPGQKDASYRGFREGRGIWGVWSVDAGTAGGGFMIWPEE
jgi:hypothetical protein